MRKLLIAGNWKMNGSKASIEVLISGIKQGLTNNVDWAVFPSYPHLCYTMKQIDDKPIMVGAQNVSEQDAGAFTGEVSAEMLKDLGCQMVLIGHSERRQLYGESDELVADKLMKAQKKGLVPVLCLGETQAEREAGETESVIERQLNAVMNKTSLEKVIIAYEPVWAIGTGLSATPEQAQEVHAFIRNQVKKHDQKLAVELRILYGGSVKSSSAQALFAMEDIDGGLIGGASLKAEEFLAIGACAKG